MAALMKQQARRERWEEYIADGIGALVTRLFRMSGAKDFKLPLYSELNKKKQPEMSAEEVKEHVLERLTAS